MIFWITPLYLTAINLIGLGDGSLMASKQSQERAEKRIRKAISFQLQTNGYSRDDLSRDVSLTRLSLGRPTKQDFTIAAGPAVQYVDESARAAQIRVGGDAHAAYTARLSKPWLLKIMVDYTQITSMYTRIQGNALLVNTFY